MEQETLGSDAKPLTGQRRLKIRASDQIVRLPSSELHRALRAVVLAASADEDRPHLRAVHFEASDELCITATDGHWLAQWKQDAEELPKTPAAMLVDLTDVLRLIPLLAVDAKERDQATINFDQGAVTLTDGTILPFTKVNSEPPPYNTLWPKTPATGQPVVAFMAGLLARCMKSFTQACPDGVAINMQLRGAESGVFISAEALPEFQVIVMPARTDATVSTKTEPS